MWPQATLKAAIRAAQAAIVKAATADDARAAAAKNVLQQANTAPTLQGLKDAVTQLYGDAYLAGAHVAAGLAGGQVAAAFGAADAATNWDSWKPGSPEAALQAADGGLADLLQAADVTIKGMVDTQVTTIGNAIADGIAHGWSIDTVAASLDDVVGNPARAYVIANTETARAMSTASLDTYSSNEVQQIDWLVADPCDICAENAADGPYALYNEPDLPAHPNCRCAYAPHIDDTAAAADEVPVDDSTDGEVADDSSAAAGQLAADGLQAAADAGAAVAQAAQAAQAADEAVAAAPSFPARKIPADPTKSWTRQTARDNGAGDGTAKHVGKATMWTYRDARMTDAEDLAVNKYVHDSHTINSYLRGDSGLLDNEWGRNEKAKIEKQAQALDGALDKSMVYKDSTVYRGVPESLRDALGSMVAGDTYSDPAYLSTSFSDSMAKAFGSARTLVLQIVAPKGSRGLILGGYHD